ncbi:MAG: UDP-3-O-(3-hydroxymyristoyl)glucosamine N-acyltransferase [Pirellulaceae bacterium]|nr:UDP-3-O-(3-hydroxymyristoyl)glucosamine N-acyltransferase [Pirellulaceae bacterium]
MLTLEQISTLVGGVIVGDPTTVITGVETIEGAREGDLTFAVNQKNTDKLANSQASAALVSPEIIDCPVASVQCENVQKAFTLIAEHLRPASPKTTIGVSDKATVSDSATVGKNVTVYPGAFIGDHCTIGDGTTIYPGACLLENCQIGCQVSIYPNAVLYENTQVGDRTNIHANAVIGAHGFGYDSGKDGHKLSAQLGHVEIGNDADIGACTTIDRGTFGSTRIGHGSKLDNQVMIGHNCQIGEHNLLCSQVGIAGSSQTGNFVVMAGQVGIGDHLAIGDRAILGAKSGVMHNLAGDQTYVGAPAILARDRFQIFAAEAKLPEMRKQFKRLVRQVDRLEDRLSSNDTAEAA